MSSSDPLNKCSLSGIIKGCDYIGSFITFRINDDNEFKSIIGGISTIVFTGFCIFYTIYTAIPFLKKENVNFIYANKVLEANPFVDFTTKKMMIAFSNCFTDERTEFETPAVEMTKGLIGYRIKARFWVGEEDIVDIPIPIRFCLKEDFPPELADFYDINGIDLMYCPQFDQFPKEEFSLAGLYTDDYLKYIIIETYITEAGKKVGFDIIKTAMQMPMEFGM